jgi:hypothetical protein
MWAQGSVVLMWHNPAVEFYFKKLRPGVTHVPIDSKTALIDKVHWLRENDDKVGC